MGPKRKQEIRRSASIRGGPKKQVTSRSTNKSDQKKLGTSSQRSKNPTHTPTSGNSPGPSSQFLLGRTNKLSDFLTASQDKKSTEKTKKGLNKTKLEFEEDDGFIYKRSQSMDFSDDEGPMMRGRLDNPISRLKQEMGNISDDDEDISIQDLKPTKRTKNNKQTSAVRKKTKSLGRPNNYNNNNSILTDENMQLFPAIESTKYNRGFQDDSSDGYVEQVSHHKLDLVDEDSIARIGKQPLNKRRNSYYNRGKRVSSIGNGFQGEPHGDVPASDYYKLLDMSLPEPDRMRQLLIWCLKKKLDEEEKVLKTKVSSTEDQTIINIAKVIKEEVLSDLMEKQISISWYSKPKGTLEDMYMAGKEVVVPNPQNMINLENIDIYSKKLKSLIKEKKDWNTSFQKTIQPVSNLSLNSFNVDENNLLDYLKADSDGTKINHNYEEMVKGNLINKIETDYKETKDDVISRLEPSINKVADASYRLSRVSELSKSLLDNNLNNRVSSLLKSYVIKNKINNYDLSKSSSSWPVPNKSITTRELLRGITRLEPSKK